MRKWTISIVGLMLLSALSGVALAQGRGGAEWTTANANAQRTGSQQTDPKISVDTVGKSFQFLWKVKSENVAAGGNSLSAPVLMDRVIGYKGFRALEFLAGSSNYVIGMDSDLGRVEWKMHLTPMAGASPAATAACPGGMSPTVSRLTPMIPIAAQPGGGGGGGRGASGPGRPGGGGGGRGPSGGNARPTGVPAANRVYVIASDGSVRTLNVQTGDEVDPPARFLSPGAKVSGVITIDGTVYAATADGCGGNANGIYALDLASKSVMSWKTSGGSVAGTAGAAFSTDGTLFAATTDGDLVALNSKTLQVKDSFSAGKSAFNSSPTVFKSGNKDVVAVSNSDGKIYLLDGAGLKSALATSAKYVNAAPNTTAGAISTFKGTDGTQWLYAAAVGSLAADTKFPMTNGAVTNGAIVAFKVIDQGGKLSLEPAWVSRDMATPLAPAITNGVVFALASGAQGSKPAVLYALDATSGKDLWNSGTTVTAHASANAGLAVAASQLYFGTVDGTLWTFGYYMEH
jgi:hypothetical protein